MSSVFFSHSYKEPEGELNAHFMKLFQGRNIVSVLDVKSEGSNLLNSAKLERQLGFTKGLISVLPRRENEDDPEWPFSAYMMYEIMTGVRAGKPVLVFAEDTLPTGLFPRQVSEERFSRRSFWRDASEHLQAIDTFQAYVGKSPTPRVRITNRRRFATVLGFNNLEEQLRLLLKQELEAHHYDVFDLHEVVGDPSRHDRCHALVRGASLMVAVLDGLDLISAYLLGMARASLTPTVALQFDRPELQWPAFPEEYGPRRIFRDDACRSADVLKQEIFAFEDEAISIDRKDEIDKYIDFVIATSLSVDAAQRTVIKNEIRNDNIKIGEVSHSNIGDSGTVNKTDDK